MGSAALFVYGLELLRIEDRYKQFQCYMHSQIFVNFLSSVMARTFGMQCPRVIKMHPNLGLSGVVTCTCGKVAYRLERSVYNAESMDSSLV